MATRPSVSETELELLTGAQTPPPLLMSDNLAQDISCNLTFNSSSTSTPIKPTKLVTCNEETILLIGLLPVKAHSTKMAHNKDYSLFKYRSLLKPKSKRVTFQLNSTIVDTNDEIVRTSDDNLSVRRKRRLKKEVTKKSKMWKHYKMAKKKGLKLWRLV